MLLCSFEFQLNLLFLNSKKCLYIRDKSLLIQYGEYVPEPQEIKGGIISVNEELALSTNALGKDIESTCSLLERKWSACPCQLSASELAVMADNLISRLD